MTEYGWSTEGKTIVSDFLNEIKNRTFLITGPSQDGIGAETAISLAHGSPSQIILLGRSISKIQSTIDTIHSINASIKTKFIPIELSSLNSVRAAVKTILEDKSIPHIDVLVNNAAIMANPYTLSADGFESQFATNHLSHFLLTNLLMPKLLAGGAAANPKARIINVSSWGHVFSDIRYHDPGFESGRVYTPWEAYGQAKTANILMAVFLDQQLRDKGIRVFALHPGSIATGLQQHVAENPDLVRFALEYWAKLGKEMPQRKSLQQGCATTLRAALDPELGALDTVYLQDCQLTRHPDAVSPYALDTRNAEMLWELSEEMVGERFRY